MITTPDDNELRARIYREAMLEAGRQAAKIDEENRRLKQGVIDSGLQLSKLLDRERELERRMKRYQEEILELERHNEELFAALNSVRNTLMRASNDIETLIRVD